jgi:hypothetical protein
MQITSCSRTAPATTSLNETHFGKRGGWLAGLGTAAAALAIGLAGPAKASQVSAPTRFEPVRSGVPLPTPMSPIGQLSVDKVDFSSAARIKEQAYWNNQEKLITQAGLVAELADPKGKTVWTLENAGFSPSEKDPYGRIVTPEALELFVRQARKAFSQQGTYRAAKKEFGILLDMAEGLNLQREQIAGFGRPMDWYPDELSSQGKVNPRQSVLFVPPNQTKGYGKG